MKHQKLLLITALLVIIGVIGTIFLLETPSPPSVTQSPKPVQQPPKTTQQSSKPTQIVVKTNQTVKNATKLRFKPKDGQTLAFHFEGKSNAKIDFGFITPNIATSGNSSASAPSQGQKTPVTMQTSGELYLKYFALKPDVWQVAAKLADVTYQLNQETPRYVDAISYPFTFQMTTLGFLSHFKFTKNIPTEAQQFVEQLLNTLQIAFPKESKIEWRTKEIDKTGRYQAIYKLNKMDTKLATLTKQKLKYFSTRVASFDINPAMSKSQTQIENSLTTVTTSVKGPWFSTLKHTEKINSLSGTYKWAETQVKAQIHQIKKDLTGVFPATFAQFLNRLNAAKFAKSKYYNTDPYFDKLGKNLDMDSALNLFEQLKNSKVPNANRTAEKFFVNYLRQHPQAAFDVVNLLDGDPKRKRFDQSTQLVLWRLITEAGHVEAQQAIVNTLNDSNRSHLTKMRALAYMHDFEYPEASTVNALWQFTSGLDTKDDREYRTMSLYALGSLGNNDKFNDVVKPEIGKLLVTNLEGSDDPREQAVILGAIGNYGSAEVLDAVEPYFTAKNEGVRASAYDALRHVEAPRAIEMLTTHYEAETSPNVRAAAVKNFSKMTPTLEGVNWANKAVLKTDASKEQIPLVEVLGKTLEDYPDNEGTLRALLKKDVDNKVKKNIYKYIVPAF
ncbi:HEAT repeat domain-containing protein [Candidatus Halobeggiatoa sp. HSG11]|nr:HEAT repeat domain-containing protein [Candidatus Halobeggiatoa sp. HSG11]